MKRLIITIVCLIAFVFAVYAPVLKYGFVDFDDPEYTQGQKVTINGQEYGIVPFGLTAAGVQWAFTTTYIANWHPLTWMSMMLDAQVWRGYAPGYHLTNILLHIANVLLVFLGLRRMTGAHWRSAMVAALFALHPMHVESVAWVAERKDVLSTFFGLLTIQAYLSWIKWRGMREYLIMATLYALSLMSKAMLVTLPFALLLLDYWPLGRGFWILDFGFWIGQHKPRIEQPNPVTPRSSLILEKLPLLAMAIGLCAMTWAAQRGANELQEGDWVPPRLAAANAVVSYARYLGKLFWPSKLAVMYPHPSLVNGATWPAPLIASSIALLLGITTLAILLRRTRPYFIVGWLWFLGTFVPVIGFVQIGRQAMADRYSYVPFLGLYVIIAWGITDLTARLSRRNVIVPPFIAAALIALSIVTSRQITYWSDSITLFRHALEVTTDNWLIHNNLAGVINRLAVVDQQEGRGDLAAQRWKESSQHLEEALRIYPTAAWVHNHYGSALGLMGKLYESQTEFEKAIALDPKSAEYHHNLGIILIRRNLPEQAVAAYRRALELNPNYAEAHRNLAMALGTLGRIDEAAAEIALAKRANPSNAADYDRTLAAIKAQKHSGSAGPASQPRP